MNENDELIIIWKECPCIFLVLMWKCMKNLIEFRILCAYLTAVTVLCPNYLSVYMTGEQD